MLVSLKNLVLRIGMESLPILLLLLPTATFGQLSLALSSGSGAPGTTVSLSITLGADTGTQPAGLQWTLNYPSADFMAVQVAASSSATMAGKSISCAGQSGSLICLLVGLNPNLIPNGVVAIATLQISATTTSPSSSILLTNVVAASPDARGIPISGSGGVVTIIPGSFTNSGSMAQIASAGFWTTTFTIVNNGASAASIHMNFFDDDGNPLPLPLIFPQTSPIPSIPTTTLDRTLNPGALLIVQTTGSTRQSVQTGWAQLLYSGNVTGYAVFGQTTSGSPQEAVAPLETRDPGSFVLSFDTTGGYAAGVALANVSRVAASIPVLIRDDNGNLLQSTAVPLVAQGHTSFDLVSRFGITAQRRGTLEFQTPAGGQISVLGLRFPPGAAFSTIPTLAK